MTTDFLQRIEHGTSPVAAGAGAAPAPGPNTPNFQRLLESLQKLADQHRQSPKIEDADQLRAAMAAADDGFVTAMDLRKKLEAAFRERMP